jgi:hypothetical protein
MEWRIGVHLGDVLIEGDDILGDGVNIAARLEGIAEPGGIVLARLPPLRWQPQPPPWRGIARQLTGAASSIFKPAQVRQAARQPNMSSYTKPSRELCADLTEQLEAAPR